MRKDVTPHYEGADVLATPLEAAGWKPPVTVVEDEFKAAAEEAADPPPRRDNGGRHHPRGPHAATRPELEQGAE